jgi:hypothetical protein
MESAVSGQRERPVPSHPIPGTNDVCIREVCEPKDQVERT